MTPTQVELDTRRARLRADVNLAAGEVFGARLIGFYDEAESFRRTVSTERYGFLPSIGFRLGGGHGADIAASTGAIFDNNGVPKLPPHGLGNQAPHDVRHATRRVGHDYAQGLVWKCALGMNGWRGKHAGGKRQGSAAGEHQKPPL